MNRELTKLADELSREKGLNREQLGEVLKDSIIAAISKRYGKHVEPDIHIDLEKGNITIYVPKKVVKEVTNKWLEISKEEAMQYNSNVRIGSVVKVPVSFESMGRQAAMIAKQRLIEKLRETEKQVILDEYQNRIGEIITGVVIKSDNTGLELM